MRDKRTATLESATPCGLTVAFSLAGVLFVLLSTSRYGVGISPDSTAYISAARGVLAGQGLRCHDGSLYTAWPPLFPVLLAIPGLVGIDAATAARFLNAFALGGIIFASGVFFSRCLRSNALILIALSSVTLCAPLVGISSMAWTEPVFTLLVILFVLQIARFLRNGRTWSLMAPSILGSLCLMQRYTGVTVVIAGVVLLLSWQPGPGVLARLRHVAVFVAISCTPLALWMARNYRLTNALTGQARQRSVYSIWTNIGVAADTATRWVLPASIPLSVRLIIIGGLIVLAIAVLFRLRDRLPSATERDSSCLWSAGAVTLTYIPLILYTHQIGVPNEPLNDRYLAPLCVLTLWLAFVAADRVWSLLALTGPRGPMLQHLFIGLSALWLAYPIEHAANAISERLRKGAGEYSTRGWQGSPLVKWLRDHPLEGSLRSNAPDALYALTGMHALVSPHRTWDIEEFRKAVSTDAGPVLVWFGGSPRTYLYDLDELASLFYLEEVATFADGGVYRFVPATACVFGDSRIFSHCRIPGVWSCTFTNEKSDAAGTVTSWVLRADGTTESFWALRSLEGAVVRWRPSCRYTRSDEAFQFHCDGVATRDANDATSPYSLDVSGAVDGDAATGTYRIEFAGWRRPGTVNGAWRMDLAQPVRRLYAQASQAHVYTIDRAEASGLSGQPSRAWLDEGVAFYAYPEGRQPPDAQPIYRLRSPNRDAQILTVDERERDQLTGGNSPAWRYDGIAFYAYRENLHPPLTQPVHRFWSETLRDYFYTASEAERQTLLDDSSQGWTYEGIAWYAVGGS